VVISFRYLLGWSDSKESKQVLGSNQNALGCLGSKMGEKCTLGKQVIRLGRERLWNRWGGGGGVGVGGGGFFCGVTLLVRNSARRKGHVQTWGGSLWILGKE